MLRLLRRLVQTESPSLEKAAVDRLGRLLAREWRRRGAAVRLLRQRQRGNHLRASVWLGRGRPSGQLLVLGHLDTVYPLGTLRRMPFRVAGRRVHGPGVYDMKAGLVMALFAVDALRQLQIAPQKRLLFLFTSDEEIGSDSSRRWIEAEARRSDAVLVLEPSAGRDGRLKTARKGVGLWTVTAHGRAAHAGINPQDGVNAIHELALQIARIVRFHQPRRGITVNADVIAGGTRSNVIAERATAEVDVRVWRMADAARLARKFRALRPVLRGARLEVRGELNRPPLERTREVVRLFRHAQRLAREMGWELNEAATGGGSDGNLTAALGIPTLDGLGAVGGGAHSPNEFIDARSLPERAALLAGLLATL
ncbi:MAG: M20 family metallopeptidase [Firmicutes bacterium]|nr:M20 family metallopeptidase [Bacillota bacterium]